MSLYVKIFRLQAMLVIKFFYLQKHPRLRLKVSPRLCFKISLFGDFTGSENFIISEAYNLENFYYKPMICDLDKTLLKTSFLI